MSDDAPLKRASVSFETRTGKTASLGSEAGENIAYDIENHAQCHDRPGYRDGFVEVTFTVEKWENTGHTVVDFTPEGLREFLDEAAATIDCEVVDAGGDA
ncbi:hypothetical protein [Haloarcula sp. JP-L23]|uniref:hypothetical protein n=1 Tax=Haloarcula sp. JP-L23 TaxID=2716717 RepID=UPI00140EC4F6|nr:hypothetical protein G9465_24770 [Haloarcula sp. JP-L23]